MSLLYTANPKTKAKFKPRRAHDFYPTHDRDIQATYAYAFRQPIFKPASLLTVLDVGAGEGPWGRILKEQYPLSTITGVEVRPTEWMQPQGYDHWRHGDFLTMPFYADYDLILGNPPYNIAEDVIRRAWSLLSDGGMMMFLLLLNFWSTQDRAVRLFRQIKPIHVAPYAKRPSFTGDGKTDAREYALFIWQKGNIPAMTTTGHIIQSELVPC